MSISLSPKALFQQNEDATKAFRAIVHNTHFQQAMSAALADFAQGRRSAEEIAGANLFINTLLNLCEKVEPPRTFPAKVLNHRALDPAEKEAKKAA